MPNRPSDIDTVSEAATAEYLRRSNRTALENMIALCLHVTSPDEMVDFLRTQADFIEEDLA